MEEDDEDIPGYLQPFDPDDKEFEIEGNLEHEEEAAAAAAPAIGTNTEPAAAATPSLADGDDKADDEAEEDFAILEGAPGQEGRAAKGILIPNTPTEDEKAKHELTHWPFRSWCGWRVQSRAHANHHR